MNEKQNNEVCANCQKLKEECICIEGYHVLNNRMAYKKTSNRC